MACGRIASALGAIQAAHAQHGIVRRQPDAKQSAQESQSPAACGSYSHACWCNRRRPAGHTNVLSKSPMHAGLRFLAESVRRTTDSKNEAASHHTSLRCNEE